MSLEYNIKRIDSDDDTIRVDEDDLITYPKVLSGLIKYYEDPKNRDERFITTQKYERREQTKDEPSRNGDWFYIVYCFDGKNIMSYSKYDKTLKNVFATTDILIAYNIGIKPYLEVKQITIEEIEKELGFKICIIK